MENCGGGGDLKHLGISEGGIQHAEMPDQMTLNKTKTF